jgi:hypothetical protein
MGSHVGAVALDRHGAQRRAAVVEQPAADDRTIALDHDVGQHEPAPRVPQPAAEIGVAVGDRYAREGQRATLDVEDAALAAAADREPFCAGANDRGRRRVGQHQRSAGQDDRAPRFAEDGRIEGDRVGAGVAVRVGDRLPQAGQAVELVHHVAGSRQLQAGDLGVFLGTDRGGAGGLGDGSVAVGDLNVECIGAGVDVGVRTQDVKATLAERLVESLWRQKNDAATVVDTIRADPVLSEPLRRAALRAVLWRATPAETAPGTAP